MMKQLLDATGVAEAMDDLYGAMVAEIPADAPLAMIGVHTRGDVIARRLAQRLATERAEPFDQGVLDITFYRDDLAQREKAPLVRTTSMNFDLDDKLVVLVDDVLHTGRSVRAAMDAIMDFGRPMAIRLAVLIDRGGRELPIAADFVGRHLDVPDDLRVQVHVVEHDGEDGVYLMRRSQ